MSLVEWVNREGILAAAQRIQGLVRRTPLLPLGHGVSNTEIYLKLENLQPIGSFKIRGAGNAMSEKPSADGYYTTSAGNMAQGVGWIARKLSVPCRVVVPDHAPEAKLSAIEALGASIIKVPFDRWWQTLLEGHFEGIEGQFIHPVVDARVINGNGTIGLEILEDLPDVDVILVPFGGGGLSSGIAAAICTTHPNVEVYGCEVETAAPLTHSLQQGQPSEVPYTPTFVDGIGSKSVLPDMWPLITHWLKGSQVVTLRQIEDAIRILVRHNRVVAEGAGASSVAAALNGDFQGKKVACVISGGNIDTNVLARILNQSQP